jgi:hypothetical protein
VCWTRDESNCSWREVNQNQEFSLKQTPVWAVEKWVSPAQHTPRTRDQRKSGTTQAVYSTLLTLCVGGSLTAWLLLARELDFGQEEDFFSGVHCNS